MSLSQTASPEGRRGLGRYDPFRLLKRYMPRGLFWRSLLIIVTPVILLQGVVSYVFFERDLETTTHWMARDNRRRHGVSGGAGGDAFEGRARELKGAGDAHASTIR